MFHENLKTTSRALVLATSRELIEQGKLFYSVIEFTLHVPRTNREFRLKTRRINLHP